MNVLLVDDDATIRKMVKLMLQSRGFRVFDSSNGADALALSQEHPVDIVVTDVVMAGMDGLALARALAQRCSDLRVLFISGYPMDFARARQQDVRCAFLAKPFQKSELLGAISDLMETPVS